MTLDLTPKHVDADDSLSLGGKGKYIKDVIQLRGWGLSTFATLCMSKKVL